MKSIILKIVGVCAANVPHLLLQLFLFYNLLTGCCLYGSRKALLFHHDKVMTKELTWSMIIFLDVFKHISSTRVELMSTRLSVPCVLPMSSHDIHMMLTLRDRLRQLGVVFEDPRLQSSDLQSSVVIRNVPSVFSVSNDSEGKEKLRSEMKNFIEVRFWPFICESRFLVNQDLF